MTRLIAKLMMALVFAVSAQVLHAAAEPQALQDVDAAHKEALQALISTAVKEGSVSYWDTIIQSGTNAKLVPAFRQYYGLPADFPVNYSLSNTTGMVTRVQQEVSAGRVTMDVAAVASLPWVNAKVAAGQIMHYESPQYQFYRTAFDKGLGKDGYYAFNGAYVFVPMWNSEKLDFKGTSLERCGRGSRQRSNDHGRCGEIRNLSRDLYGAEVGVRAGLFQELGRDAARLAGPFRADRPAARHRAGSDVLLGHAHPRIPGQRARSKTQVPASQGRRGVAAASNVHPRRRPAPGCSEAMDRFHAVGRWPKNHGGQRGYDVGPQGICQSNSRVCAADREPERNQDRLGQTDHGRHAKGTCGVAVNLQPMISWRMQERENLAGATTFYRDGRA